MLHFEIFGKQTDWPGIEAKKVLPQSTQERHSSPVEPSEMLPAGHVWQATPPVGAFWNVPAGHTVHDVRP